MPSKLPETAIASSEYSQIAPIYDFVMRHVDYQRWASYIIKILTREHPQLRSLLEIACGTGKMLEHLRKPGWQLLGMDRSTDMLKCAIKMGSAEASPWHLWCGDMRQFALQTPVSAVLCLYDSINYCLTEDEVVSTLACVHRCLERRGIFLFDICTLYTCRKYFHDLEERDTCYGIDYIRRSTFDERTECQINEFWLRPRRQSRATYYERHIQKIYSLRTMKKLVLLDNLWDVVGIYHDFTRRPGSERSYRVHFVLRKK